MTTVGSGVDRINKNFGQPAPILLDSALVDLERELVREALSRETLNQPLSTCPDFELMLVKELVPHLRTRTAVDIGAERGNFSAAFLDLGLETVAIEASPSQALVLRQRFANSSGIRVLHVAVSSENGPVNLYLGKRPKDFAPDGFRGGAFNTLISRPDVPGVISFPSAIKVPGRTVAQLVADGLMPAVPGILKVDTEGHDLAILRGAQPNMAEVVIAEYWNRDFAMHAANTCNDVPEYADFLKEVSLPLSTITIVRDEISNRICFQVNPRASIAGSWGNIIIFKRPELMRLALEWCVEVFSSLHYRF